MAPSLRAALGALSLASPLVGAALATGSNRFGIGGTALFALGMVGYHALPFLIQPPDETRDGNERTWTLGARSQVGFAARLLGIAMWAFVAALSWTGGDIGFFLFVASLIGIGCVPVVLPDLWNRVFATRSALMSISIDPSVVTIRFPDQTKMVPYADILKITCNDKYIVLATAEEEHVVRAHHKEQAKAIAQAIAEAQARDVERRRAKAEGGPTILDRPQGVPVREWLARLDATAAVAHAAGTYRGGEGIDHETLWATLEDGDRDATARAAAGRILASAPDASVRVRVEAAAKSIADEGVRVRIAAALDPDVDRAAEALEEIEATEMKRVLSQD